MLLFPVMSVPPLSAGRGHRTSHFAQAFLHVLHTPQTRDQPALVTSVVRAGVGPIDEDPENDPDDDDDDANDDAGDGQTTGLVTVPHGRLKVVVLVGALGLTGVHDGKDAGGTEAEETGQHRQQHVVRGRGLRHYNCRS